MLEGVQADLVDVTNWCFVKQLTRGWRLAGQLGGSPDGYGKVTALAPEK